MVLLVVLLVQLELVIANEVVDSDTGIQDNNSSWVSLDTKSLPSASTPRTLTKHLVNGATEKETRTLEDKTRIAINREEIVAVEEYRAENNTALKTGINGEILSSETTTMPLPTPSVTPNSTTIEPTSPIPTTSNTAPTITPQPNITTPQPSTFSPEPTPTAPNASTTQPTPTTPQPNTPKPTTITPQPTTPKPTTKTPQPTTPQPTTPRPTTPQPTTPQPTSPQPTSPQPTSPQPTSPQPTSPQPTSPQPTSLQPTTPMPTSPLPTTPEPTTPTQSTPRPSKSSEVPSVSPITSPPPVPSYTAPQTTSSVRPIIIQDTTAPINELDNIPTSLPDRRRNNRSNWPAQKLDDSSPSNSAFHIVANAILVPSLITLSAFQFGWWNAKTISSILPLTITFVQQMTIFSFVNLENKFIPSPLVSFTDGLTWTAFMLPHSGTSTSQRRLDDSTGGTGPEYFAFRANLNERHLFYNAWLATVILVFGFVLLGGLVRLTARVCFNESSYARTATNLKTTATRLFHMALFIMSIAVYPLSLTSAYEIRQDAYTSSGPHASGVLACITLFVLVLALIGVLFILFMEDEYKYEAFAQQDASSLKYWSFPVIRYRCRCFPVLMIAMQIITGGIIGGLSSKFMLLVVLLLHLLYVGIMWKLQPFVIKRYFYIALGIEAIMLVNLVFAWLAVDVGKELSYIVIASTLLLILALAIYQVMSVFASISLACGHRQQPAERVQFDTPHTEHHRHGDRYERPESARIPSSDEPRRHKRKSKHNRSTHSLHRHHSRKSQQPQNEPPTDRYFRDSTGVEETWRPKRHVPSNRNRLPTRPTAMTSPIIQV
ncbi:hypothetical protein THRCLA_03014 [Thraustotheca clavata]|uniref:Mucin n=1 Tax=Thraustotheca clavata TaxID=74557 RepID=A0A1W0A3A5_9STRA|nr:hypothetical protein THRCLA_03014 [Thraustotheca clavata]